MKQKQIKKRIKAKKRLTSAAVALIMSGSFLPIGNVFAEEQIDQKNATANVEAKSNSKSIQKRDITESTVSNYAEFKAALQNSVVKNIYLANDISLDETFYITSNKNIYGNGHTINLKFNTVGISLAGAVCNIENVTLINQQIYSFFWSEAQNVTVNYTNVTSSGRQFIYLANGTANLYGNIEASANVEEVFQGRQLNIGDNANVKFNDTSSINAIYSINGLLVGNNANLKVISTGLGMYVASGSGFIDIGGNTSFDSSTNSSIRAVGGNILVRENAKLKATSRITPDEAILITNGSITVKNGASLEASSEGTESTVQTGNKLVFEKGSNFMITNTNTNGNALGAWPGPTTVWLDSDQGINTWTVGNTQAENPNNSYSGPLNATFTLNTFTTGQTTKGLISNNSNFQNTFNSGKVGKIAGGSYVKNKELAKTTINEVKDTDTTVSGKGEPNGKIELKVGDQVITSGTVGSDGNYSLTIPKQSAGTVIKAVVSANGLTSEAHTTVVRTALAQTTISEINTETTQVSGKGEPNAPIKIMNGDQIIAQDVIGSDGNYTLTIPKQAKDSVIKAIVEKDGLTSKAQTIVTQGSLVQTTISNIDTNTTSVSGKGEPNAKIELKVGNQVIASDRIGSDGNYSLTIPKQSVGTVVKAVVSANGLTSEAHTTVTRADLAPTTISKVDSQTTVITGTGEPGGKIELLNGNQVIVNGYVGKDGHYSLTVMKQPAGSTIIARVTMAGKESQASTVVEEKFNLQAPTIDPYYAVDANANGSITGDATKVAIFVNGVQKRVAAVNNGTYRIYTGDLGLKAGDKFEIAGIAADGTVGPKTSATVLENDPEKYGVTAENYILGSNTINGTAKSGIARVKLFVSGHVVRQTTVENGKYSIWASDVVTSIGDKVEIIGMDANGVERSRVTVTIMNAPV
ncbi:Ig-like domain-containing protein [Enterococcus hirae]